jgi:hypothetical protein
VAASALPRFTKKVIVDPAQVAEANILWIPLHAREDIFNPAHVEIVPLLISKIKDKGSTIVSRSRAVVAFKVHRLHPATNCVS